MYSSYGLYRSAAPLSVTILKREHHVCHQEKGCQLQIFSLVTDKMCSVCKPYRLKHPGPFILRQGRWRQVVLASPSRSSERLTPVTGAIIRRPPETVARTRSDSSPIIVGGVPLVGPSQRHFLALVCAPVLVLLTHRTHVFIRAPRPSALTCPSRPRPWCIAWRSWSLTAGLQPIC